ncbi:MAG: glycosyltransferase [Desulfovibrio sp.]|nr:glycosyltransferase [Desulfovibrio sp.]
MRVLFLNAVFPGPFRALARACGGAGHTVLFLAEAGQKSVTLPNVRRLRIAPPKPYDSSDAAEQECVRLLRRGARAGNAMLDLRRKGFVPDLVIAAASTGGSFYVRDVFPEAFCVCYGDWFSTQGRRREELRGNMRAVVNFAPAHVRNLWEYNALCDCHLAVTSSQWQRAQYPALLQQGIHVVHAGVNTRYFTPLAGSESKIGGATRELVTFCASPHDPVRGFGLFRKCLPRLLEERPDCLVVIAWPDKGRDGALKQREPDRIASPLELPEIPEDFRLRVRMLGPCSLDEYREILRRSTVHVYLAAPQIFSTGLLEAMSCGALVVASDTPPVREVVVHDVNGFLCTPRDTASMSKMLAEVLERASCLDHVRREARRTVRESYDAENQASRFLELVCNKMAER